MKYTCQDQLRDIFGEGLVRGYDWWAQIGSCEVSITGDRALVGDVQWRRTVKRALSSGKLRIDCESELTAENRVPPWAILSMFGVLGALGE